MRQFSRKFPDKAIEVRNVPRYAEVAKNGVGHYYYDPDKADKDDIYFNLDYSRVEIATDTRPCP